MHGEKVAVDPASFEGRTLPIVVKAEGSWPASYLCDDDGALHFTTDVRYAKTFYTEDQATEFLGDVRLVTFAGEQEATLVPVRMDAAVLMARILLEAGDKVEATDCPFWYVATKAGLRAGYICHAGPFFSRATAERTLRNKAHRFPKTAFVWCDSGHLAPEYRYLRDVAKATLKLAGVPL